ncbi:hypothetical protein MNBD_GAMMA03-1454, partial [hydrothermal vent metagenome]
LDYLQRIATTGQRFICVDFPEVIEYIQQTRKELLQNKGVFKLKLFTFDDFTFDCLYDNYQDYVMRNAIILLRSLVVVQNNGLYSGVNAKYNELFLRFRIDQVDNRDFKKVFDQQLESVCDLMHPLSVIKGRLKGAVPAILLGGGPSLDNIIPWLKQQQQKVWIFAASRICKRLLQEGITPDFIGVFDGQPLIFDYSKEMYAFEKKSILITGEHPFAPLIRQWSGLKTYSRRRFPWAKGGEENFISDGPTVTNALFGIGCYLGISQFYLAGVDFCFTPEGVCHESASIEAKNQQRDASDTKAINYRGEEVGTNIQLYDARNLFEEQMMRLQKEWPSFNAYNLNDGAAVIQGVNYAPLEQLDEVLSRSNAQKFKVVDSFQETLQFDAKVEKAFQLFLKGEVNTYSKWFLTIVKESKKGMHLSRTLFADTSKQQAKIKEVLKLKTKLEKLVDVDYQTLVNYGYKIFMDTLKPVESETDMSQQEMQNTLLGFFGGLNVASEEFLQKLEEIKLTIHFRLTELDPNTDFAVLAEHWLKDNVPGRFHVWLTHYAEKPYQYYVDHYPEQVAQLEQAFEFMKTDESALQESFKQRFHTPEEFITRLQEAFDSQDLQTLRGIIRQLHLIKSDDYSMVNSLATGMLLELKGSSEDALLHYLAIDPQRKRLFIQQQVYPLAFSSHQPDKGLEALKALSAINARYLPKLAEAFEIFGDNDNALICYQSYPFIFEDTDAFISWIRLLVQRQEIEMANTLLQKAEDSPLIDQTRLQALVDSFNN